MKSCFKICDEIRYWINQYDKLKGSGNIDKLLDIQDSISIRTFTLASYVADYSESFKGAYFNRKTEFAADVLNFRKKDMPVNQAEHEAMVKGRGLLEVETDMENTTKRLHLLLQQTNKILDGMSQRISYMKQEKMITRSQNTT
jgi:hypothetical protein